MGPVEIVLAILAAGLIGYSYWLHYYVQTIVKKQDDMWVEKGKRIDATFDRVDPVIEEFKAKMKTPISELFNEAIDNNEGIQNLIATAQVHLDIPPALHLSAGITDYMASMGAEDLSGWTPQAIGKRNMALQGANAIGDRIGKGLGLDDIKSVAKKYNEGGAAAVVGGGEFDFMSMIGQFLGIPIPGSGKQAGEKAPAAQEKFT